MTFFESSSGSNFGIMLELTSMEPASALLQ